MSDVSADDARRGSSTLLISVILILLNVYVFSPTPVAYVLIRSGLIRNETLETAIQIFYMPLSYAASQNTAIEHFYEWQWKWLGL